MVELTERHIKGYSHFDGYLDLAEANRLVNDHEAVAAHKFYPFIAEEKVHQPYRTKKPPAGSAARPSRPDKKLRLLMKAARRDAAIYAAYRGLLIDPYEAILSENSLSEAVIAYRHIPVFAGSTKGKCNIHHAHEIFEFAKQIDQSVCVVLDISKFFDHIDHRLLKAAWRNVLGRKDLPKDHYAVFKAITRYSYVDLEKLLFRLGHTRTIKDHKGSDKTVVQRKDALPAQLCTPDNFKKMVAGRYRGQSQVVRLNENKFGIPQGSPISDVLANLYLLEFDKLMKAHADSLGGIYRRYSDDIVFVVPGGLDEGRRLRDYVRSEIEQHGSELKIKQRKTHVVAFERDDDRFHSLDAPENERHPDGLEYLGFRFDGKTVRFRDSTIGKLRRKVRDCVKAEVYKYVRRHPARSCASLVRDFPIGAITPKVGRIDPLIRDAFIEAGRKPMSFWSYALSAEKVFGSTGHTDLLTQIPYRKWIREDVAELLPRYFKKHRQSVKAKKFARTLLVGS